MLRVRKFPESNYRAVFFNGKTIRSVLDPTLPITELGHPEFYDVKITNKCYGQCPYCYMNSTPDSPHAENAVDKIMRYFGAMNLNERPFQVAIGGGEPTESPEFIEVIWAFRKLGILPNYTTNGSFIRHGIGRTSEIVSNTRRWCGGVAVSCHPHLSSYWMPAADLFAHAKIKLNFHIIISDKGSCDYFRAIYDDWKEQVSYFVLLPYQAQGRAEKKEVDWEYLLTVLPDPPDKIAFGAGFYPNIVATNNKLGVSLYEPEIMSKFLDLSDMKLYPSSFEVKEEE